jgi:hypothetical protein
MRRYPDAYGAWPAMQVFDTQGKGMDERIKFAMTLLCRRQVKGYGGWV